ncbi:ketopantoate hydroxymethyltransferase [Paenibacillus hodogayensis]|uniref:Ketopantoate hydroxymethyltransferase n=1 Tax=Paenibacillus hodogayensis TaxID=279208 RepID=A0ABV5W1M7_9BACL
MIEPNYLAELTAYTNAKIAKVVLNGGAYTIEQFDLKQVAANLLTMEYRVPAGAVTDITRIELMSANGQLISANNVYVPITTETILKHTVKVLEV